MATILGKSGVNKELIEIYLGNSGISKKEKELYLGKSGVNKQMYSSRPVLKIKITSVPLNGTRITFDIPFVFTSITAKIDATQNDREYNESTTLELFLKSESNYYKIIMEYDTGYAIRPGPGEEPEGSSPSIHTSLYSSDSNGSTVNYIDGFAGNPRYNGVYAYIKENFLELNADVQWTMGYGESPYPRKIPMSTFPNQELMLIGYRASLSGGTGSIQNLNIWGF